MIDFKFIEFYINKKYSQKVYEYFDITKQVITLWRKTNEVPGARLKQFLKRESSVDVHVLLKELYPKKT